MAWFKTRKGRGYGKYDNKSHGTPLADERARVLGRAQGVHGASTASSTQGVDEPAPDRRRRARGAGARQLRDAPWACCGTTPSWSTALTDRLVEVAGDRARSRSTASTWAAAAPRSSTTRGFIDVTRLPGGDVEEARREAAQPRRARRRGAPGSTPSPRRSTAGRCSSPARPTSPSRPTSPASPRTSSDMPGWGWYERDTNPRGIAAAAADHRVHQRRRWSWASPRSTWPTTR